MLQCGHVARWASKRARSTAGSVPSRYSVTNSTSSWQLKPTVSGMVALLRLEVVLERGTDAGARPVQQHSLIRVAQPQDVTHLRTRETLHVAQCDHVALPRRECGD